LNFSYKEIVVGWSVEAIFYAIFNRAPLIHTGVDYEIVDFIEQVSWFKIKYNDNWQFLSSSYQKENLTNCLELSNIGCLVLSLGGLLPIGKSADKIFIRDNELSLIHKELRVPVKIKFNKITVFNDNEILNLNNLQEEGHKEYKVYDYFFLRSTHANIPIFDLLEYEDNFVQQIFFLGSYEENYHFVAVSELEYEELIDPEFSESMSILKIDFRLNEFGYPLKLYDKAILKTGLVRPKFKILNLHHFKRKIREKTAKLYEDSKEFTWNQQTLNEIYEDYYIFPKKKKDLTEFIYKLFFK